MALFQGGKSPFSGEQPASPASAPFGPRLAGDLLRQQREAFGLDLDGVAAVLRIKPAYLAALEEGRLDELPGPAYAIGFMRAYSEYLGLDSGEVLRRVKQESETLAARPGLSFPMPLAERSMPGGGMFLVVLILALCGYGTWYYLSAGEHSRPERVSEVPAALLPPMPKPAVPHPTEAADSTNIAAPTEESPASSERPKQSADAVGGSTPLPAGAASAAPARITEAAAVVPSLVAPGPAGDVAAPAQIVIRATADSWVQIGDATRSVLFARILKSGESYRVPEGAGLSMRTGNAGALEITVNGDSVPPIGRIGAVRRNVALDPQALVAGTAVRE
jgi:cytoskeleton protein RodZ